MEPIIGRGLVFPSMQVDSVKLSHKHLVGNQDKKITVEYGPYTEKDDEQEPFTFRKSIHGNRNVSRNNLAIHKLNYYSDTEDEDTPTSTITLDETADKKSDFTIISRIDDLFGNSKDDEY